MGEGARPDDAAVAVAAAGDVDAWTDAPASEERPSVIGPGILPQLRGLAVPIDSLRRFHTNPRTHDIDVIRGSLRENGQFRPIVVNVGTHTGRHREILAGNGTHEAALAEGWTEIAATWVDADDVAAAKIVAIDNRANDLAGYDIDALVATLDIAATGGDLSGTGFEQSDLDRLRASMDPVPDDDQSDPVRLDKRSVTDCPSCGHTFTPVTRTEWA